MGKVGGKGGGENGGGGGEGNEGRGALNSISICIISMIVNIHPSPVIFNRKHFTSPFIYNIYSSESNGGSGRLYTIYSSSQLASHQ